MRTMNGKPRTLILLAIAATAALVSTPTGCSQPPTSEDRGVARSPASTALHEAMDKLWMEHVAWTRLVIVSTAASLPDLDATTARLLQNQTDIGGAIKPYYGDAAGQELTRLLRSHITGAAEVLAAAKAKDTPRLDTAKKAWYANADTIADFLNKANADHWPAADVRSMMRDHLDLTLAEAVAQLEGRYADSVGQYDRVETQILQMADMLSDGIVAQFPKKF